MGTKRFDNIVVVDIELTCYATKDEYKNIPAETIEIGVCMLNSKTFNISRSHSYIIRPEYSDISNYCTQLTGHTQESVKNGIPFAHACNKMSKEYGTKNRVWASWGDGDRIHFEEECISKDATYPFGESHINVSDLFTLAIGMNIRLSVTDALKVLGKDFLGRQHCGADDAFNTAVILKYLLHSGRIY
jgi:inhibitor of KinA sporulation pathway (predicted exonuclease)